MTRTNDPTNSSRQTTDDRTAETLRMLLPTEYFEHFTLEEYRFRWADIISTDPTPTARMHHAAMTIALRNFDSLGSAHPRVDTIAAGMHVSEGTARKALKDLEHHGWMHIEPRDGFTNVYQALLPASSVPAILQLVERRRKGRLRTNTLAISHQLAVALLARLGVKADNTDGLPRIRGQISQFLAAADVETEARFMFNHVMSEMPENVIDPVKICHTKLKEYSKLYTTGRKKPTNANIDPERAAFVQSLLEQMSAALSAQDHPDL
jgi:hypothetical protein